MATTMTRERFAEIERDAGSGIAVHPQDALAMIEYVRRLETSCRESEALARSEASVVDDLESVIARAIRVLTGKE